jgi:hypothetical protein
MRLTRTILGFAAAACLTLSPVYAGSHGRPSTVKPTTVSGQPAATPSGKSTKGKSTAAQTTKIRKPTTTTTTPKTATALNPIAGKISSKPKLNAKITAMLPVGADGTRMSLNDASRGFKNQGQFIAALHASQRSNCGSVSCFTLIKADMVDKHMSLGQSIQDVKHIAPSAATTEAHHAEHEAEHELGEHHETEQHEARHDDRDHRKHGEAHGNKIAKEIARNPQLSAKVQALLPAGMTIKKAAKGFSSEREFLAALHAAQNLNIPFARIKSEMTGHDNDSLTQAIRELKPTVDARTAARTAQQQASADIRATAPAHADHD